jgi:uncharacterized protein
MHPTISSLRSMVDASDLDELSLLEAIMLMRSLSASRGPRMASDDETVAAGVMFIDRRGRMLFVKRSDRGGEWAFPGGGVEEGETPAEAACRECCEELDVQKAIDFDADMLGEPVAFTQVPNGGWFETFEHHVNDAFEPALNDEHTAFKWTAVPPEPLHPSVKEVLAQIEHRMSAPRLAEDEVSMRHFDGDGRMRVKRTPISKANVCEYLGAEIPNYQALGLTPDRRYRLYRDPVELAKAAATFAGIPILEAHKPITAGTHQRDLVVGAVGDDVRFEAPYLTAPLVFWDGRIVREIEMSTKRQLSSGYYYKADMTPGVTEAGESYDGVMRNIVANHVAVVREGRAGPDVLVADSAEEPRWALLEHALASFGK